MNKGILNLKNIDDIVCVAMWPLLTYSNYFKIGSRVTFQSREPDSIEVCLSLTLYHYTINVTILQKGSYTRIHFYNLKISNSACIVLTLLKFGGRTLLSLYLKNKILA